MFLQGLGVLEHLNIFLYFEKSKLLAIPNVKYSTFNEFFEGRQGFLCFKKRVEWGQIWSSISNHIL